MSTIETAFISSHAKPIAAATIVTSRTPAKLTTTTIVSLLATTFATRCKSNH